MTLAARPANQLVIGDGPVLHGLASLAAAVSTVRLLDAQVSAALSAQPGAPGTDGFCALFEAELRDAVRDGQAHRAVAAADALWRRTDDLERVYRVLRHVLDTVGASRRYHQAGMLREARVVTAASSVVARLRAQSAAPARGSVVVVTAPPGDRSAVVLDILAHLLEAAGQRAVAVPELDPIDLPAVLAEESISGVLVSVQSAAGASSVRRFLAAVQRAAPQLPRWVTGAAAPPATAPGTLVVSDVAAVLAQLAPRSSPLTPSETRVLECVAAGLTNAQAAVRLGVAPATVKTHLDHIFDKTQTQQRAAAVATALRSGWLG